MRIESKEVIFILKGEPTFQEGSRFHYSSLIVDLPSRQIFFNTKHGVIIDTLDNVFLGHFLNENPFSCNEMILEEAIEKGGIFRLTAVEVNNN